MHGRSLWISSIQRQLLSMNCQLVSYPPNQREVLSAMSYSSITLQAALHHDLSTHGRGEAPRVVRVEVICCLMQHTENRVASCHHHLPAYLLRVSQELGYGCFFIFLFFPSWQDHVEDVSTAGQEPCLFHSSTVNSSQQSSIENNKVLIYIYIYLPDLGCTNPEFSFYYFLYLLLFSI